MINDNRLCNYVSARAAMFAVAYMRAMLPESVMKEDECLILPISKVGVEKKGCGWG